MPKLVIDVSDQTEDLLQRVTERGLWGRTKEEVAARLVDAGLVERFVEPLRLGVLVRQRQRKDREDC